MSRKRAVKANRSNVYQFRNTKQVNGTDWDYEEQPQPVRVKKTWTSHDLKVLKPITHPLREMYEAFFEGNHITAHGSAGTGKTMAAIWLAMNEILNPETEADHLIIVRSAVASRDQGFLPGTEEEKMEVFERPYHDIFGELFGRRSTYKDMKEAKLVQFSSTSFIRGLTWDNAIVVVDEGQNLTFEEINTVMTRAGKNTRIIFAGDLPQKDLKKKGDETGFPKAIRVMERTGNFAMIQFTRHDIVRSAFVKSWITAVEDDDKDYA